MSQGELNVAEDAPRHAKGAIAAVVLALVCVAASAISAQAYVTEPATIWRIAGNGTPCADATTSCGDGPTATAANLANPASVAVDGAGNVYIGDQSDQKIRKVTPAGAISTIAGNGTACANATTSCGDGPTATAANLSSPDGVAIDGAGNVYIADPFDHKIRKVTPAGAISTIAGSGSPCAIPTGTCGDGPTATAANLSIPAGVAVDGAGNVYIADTGDHKIRRVTPGGAISTIAGNGTACDNPPNCGDGGAATAADLSTPRGVAVDAAGQNVFVAEIGGNEVRWITGPQAGPIGPQGPPGVAGPQGPPGKDATATCKVKKPKGTKVKVKCTVAQAASRSMLSYRLTRGKRVFAAGRRPVKNGKSVATLHARRAIKPGRYTLTLILDSGDQTVLLRQTVRIS